MTPKPQSVCKHCQQGRNRHHWKNAWCPHPDKDANMVSAIGPIWLRSTFEPVAEPASPPHSADDTDWEEKRDEQRHTCRKVEPASTGEQPLEKKDWDADKDWIEAARPSGPSEPQPRKMIDVGGKEHDETIQCKYSDCKLAPQPSAEPKQLSGMEDYCDECPDNGRCLELGMCRATVPAPQPVSGDAPKYPTEPTELHRQVAIAKQNGARWIQVAVKDLEPLLAGNAPDSVNFGSITWRKPAEPLIEPDQPSPMIFAPKLAGNAQSYMTCIECGINVCDHIVKRLAGVAPKVEELLDLLCNTPDKTWCQRGRTELRELLRHFTHASQTPEKE